MPIMGRHPIANPNASVSASRSGEVPWLSQPSTLVRIARNELLISVSYAIDTNPVPEWILREFGELNQ